MKIISAVINDLVTDQRVHRSCMLMHEMGYDVTLIGRRLPDSLPMPARPYSCIRMRLPFRKGPAFYAVFNVHLFFRLLFSRFDAVWANDLDTLWASRLATKLKGKKLVFDSHEYFTGVPELEGRPRVQKFWKRIESRIVPKLPFMITVNDSIADLFRKEYNIPVLVVRNVPLRNTIKNPKTRAELGLPNDKKILLVQGRGINIDRGVEEMVLAMKQVEGALLLIIGGGDVFPVIQKMVADEKLQDKVITMAPMNREYLMQYTMAADIGLTLDKDTNINYRFSLPNKIFDYIQAGIAVMCTNLVEVAKIVNTYAVGTVTASSDPDALAATVNKMISDEAQLNEWKNNSSKVSAILCWENESRELNEKLREYLG
ncbi:MAG TPA: glycosyltransferase [Bacteroidales bacterium]|nr:glycosyltransferase [Bacteroidales bacterium]HCB62666.1 glycosyltransferase [Bacteroidales bacterium]HCY23786.1 glycosyltransferase [Bacteroidales bacterium]